MPPRDEAGPVQFRRFGCRRIPREVILRFISAVVLFLPLLASAQAPKPDPKKLHDAQYCYALSAMAQVTVQRKNEGLTLDDQLQRRQKQLGAASAEYKLMEDVTRQIYEKDVRDVLPVLADVHHSCLDAKGIAGYYTDTAIRTCPAIGTMINEVSALRRRGASAEQVAGALGERYGELPKRYDGGLEKLIAKYKENTPPDNGTFDYTLCMIRGMAAGQ
jgi:hypothetical protein